MFFFLFPNHHRPSLTVMVIIMVVIDSEVEDTTKRPRVSAYAPPGTLRPFCNDGVAEGKKYKYKSDQFHNLKCAKRCKYKCESNDWNKLTPIISTKRFLCLLFSGKDTQLPSHPPNDGCPTSWKSSGEKTQRTQFATSPLKLLLIIAESEAKSDNVKKKQNTKISCFHIIY